MRTLSPKPCGCPGRRQRRKPSTWRFGSSRRATAESRPWSTMRPWRPGGTSRNGSTPGSREGPDGVIRYLLDSSALWRILRDSALRGAWAEVVSIGAIGSCHAQRVEFRRSARTIDEYEQMSGMFDALYPDAPIPKGAWRWIESAQYRLLRQGAHRGIGRGSADRTTAAQHDLVVLHDDKDSRPPPDACRCTGTRHLRRTATADSTDTRIVVGSIRGRPRRVAACCSRCCPGWADRPRPV